MPSPRLTRAAVHLINQQIDDLFDSLKVRLLGPQSVDRRLYIGFLRDHSIPGIFEQAVAEEGGRPDFDLLDRLISVTSDYIDQHKSATKAQTKKTVQDFLHDVDTGKLPLSDLYPTVQESLNDLFGKVTSGVMKVVVTETQHAQTLGIKEGIDHINAQMGIDDPVVCFIPVRDHLLCDECKRLHFFRDTTGTLVPRAWKSSEVKAGYHTRGDEQPSWSLLHPHCRCALTTIMPGFGFDKSGRLTWKGMEHHEYDRQHGIEQRYLDRYGKMRKSELPVFEEDLAKSTSAGMKLFRALKDSYAKNADYQPLGSHNVPNDDVLAARWFADRAQKLKERVMKLQIPAPHINPFSDAASKLHNTIVGEDFGGTFYVTSLNDAAKDKNYLSIIKAQYNKMIRAASALGVDTKKYAFKQRDLDAHISDVSGLTESEISGLRAYWGNRLLKAGRPHNWSDDYLEDIIRDSKEKFPDETFKTDLGGNTLHPFVHDLFKNAAITINAPLDSLADIAKNGRFKNLFETSDLRFPGHGVGKGETDKGTRAEMEENVLKIPHRVPPTRRPVYGSLNWAAGISSYNKHRGAAPSYGEMFFTLKPHVKDRSSFTPEDSFGCKSNQVFLHQNLDKLAHSWQSERGIDSLKRIHDKINNKPHAEDKKWSYVEAQIHGGIYLHRDIESLHIPAVEDLLPETRKRAVDLGKKHGFKVLSYSVENKPEGQIHSSKVLYDPEAQQALPGIKPPNKTFKSVPEIISLVKSAARLWKSTSKGLDVFAAAKPRYEQNKNTIHNKLAHYDHYPEIIDLYNKAPISINLPEKHLPNILHEGRMKNLFETGHGMGNPSTSIRQRFELRNLGIPEETEPDARPIYGAMHPWYDVGKTHGLACKGGAPSYGDAFITLKPHVKSRSSVTSGDSFDAPSYGVLPLEGNARHLLMQWGENHEPQHYQKTKDKALDFLNEMKNKPEGAHDEHYSMGGGYHEVQIHGGVGVGDIDAIHFSPGFNALGPDDWKDEPILSDRQKQIIEQAKIHRIPVYQYRKVMFRTPGTPIQEQLFKDLGGADPWMIFDIQKKLGLAKMVVRKFTLYHPDSPTASPDTTPQAP